MPELPEVEVTRRNLESWLRPTRVTRVVADKTRITRGSSPQALGKLHGELLDASRVGKTLLLTFEGGRGLLAHLGMTGKFVRRDAGTDERWSRARFFLADGKVIHFVDPRMFGLLQAVPAQTLRTVKSVAALGPDLWTETRDGNALAAALRGSKQALKVALMDQTRLAGLGNIHAAEALFRAQLHPSLPAGSLSAAQYARLAKGIRAALRFGLARAQAEDVQYLGDGSGLKNPFYVYDRSGQPCKRCGTKIRTSSQGGRTTYFCPHCQARTQPKG